MKFELKRDYNRNGKILKAGQVLDVTQELHNWLEENDYGKKTKKKTKTASEKEANEIEL